MAEENSNKLPDFRKLAEEALKGLPKEVGETARAFFLSALSR